MKPTNITVTTYLQQADALEQAVSAIPAELTAELTADLIVRRPAENRWSVLEIVSHLADAELLASVRIRRIITQDRAKLWGYQQEHWAAALGYGQRRIETVTARFSLLRRENAELLPTDSTDEVWNYSGFHDEYGTLSLRQLIEGYLDHTAKHLEQIRKVAAELTGETPAERNFMAKTQAQNLPVKDSKEVKPKRNKEEKAAKGKNGNALVGRVKKVIKKSRRKMGEEKFEKELQRTIAFLEELRLKLDIASAAKSEKAVKTEKKNADKKVTAKAKSGNSHAKPKTKAKEKSKAPSAAPTVAQSGKASAGK